MIKEKLLETTGLVGDFKYPANTYYLNDAGKLVGFKAEDGTETMFNNAMAFDKRGRQFKKVK